MDNLIEVRGLVKRYGDFALKAVDLTVPAGCVVGLVGENGAGKTTLLRAILGLIRADEGSVALMGRAPSEPEARAEVAAVFEENACFGHLTAAQAERVMCGIVPNWDSDRYAGLLEAFGIGGRKLVKDYSKGMRIKLNLAVALARRPRLLILDEPTSGLDPVVRGELLDILLGFMQDERNAILVSSHITSDLERIADQIAYIHAGEMLFQRDKIELMEDMAVVRCSMARIDQLPEELVIAKRGGAFGASALVRNPERVRALMPDAVLDAASIDDMMRYYAGRDAV